MILNKEQTDSLAVAAEPLMLWLKENGHPHCSAIVDSEKCEVVEGLAAVRALTTEQDEPLLGLATTAKLLEELKARAEVGGYAEYRTVDSDVEEAGREVRARMLEAGFNLGATGAPASHPPGPPPSPRRDPKDRDFA